MFHRLIQIVSDRFVLFLLIGAAMFILDSGESNDASKIHIDVGDVSMLAGRWEAQSGKEATPEELHAILDFHVREEILFREAIRLGLDRDDSIVRRRLVQKMEFYIQNQIDLPDLSEPQLAAYFDQNKAAYITPPSISFQHIFLGQDKDEAINAARTQKPYLQDPAHAENWQSLGEPFLLERELTEKDHSQISELFGPDFADQVFAVEPFRAWVGPVHSSYGWHLVRIRAKRAERLPELSDIRDKVSADLSKWQLAHEQELVWQEIQARYSVSLPERAS